MMRPTIEGVPDYTNHPAAEIMYLVPSLLLVVSMLVPQAALWNSFDLTNKNKSGVLNFRSHLLNSFVQCMPIYGLLLHSVLVIASRVLLLQLGTQHIYLHSVIIQSVYIFVTIHREEELHHL